MWERSEYIVLSVLCNDYREKQILPLGIDRENCSNLLI